MSITTYYRHSLWPILWVCAGIVFLSQAPERAILWQNGNQVLDQRYHRALAMESLNSEDFLPCKLNRLSLYALSNVIQPPNHDI